MAYIMKLPRVKSPVLTPLMAVTLNIVLLYAVYSVARLEYVLENFSYFSASLGSAAGWWRIFSGGVVFDTPGIFYTNIPYILLMLLPLHLKERPGYYRVCRWVFIVINSLVIIVSLADSVYFPYTMKRTTWDVATEFGGETNLLSIAGVELMRHWYLVFLAAIMIWGMWKLYRTPSPQSVRPLWRYYAAMIFALAFAACVTVGAVRGGWLNHWYCYMLALPLVCAALRLWKGRCYSVGKRYGAYACGCAAITLLALAPVGGWRHRDIRPIALSNASAYAQRPVETSAILNTPFALLRTINSNPFESPRYFADRAGMAMLYTPEHGPAPGAHPDSMLRKNVVIIILESFGEEYIGGLNRRVLGDRSTGYAPFVDSLARRSMRFSHTYDNGTKSIDAMPSILAGIPKFVKPFILTSSAMQPVDGLPALLAKEGYETAFFHGARTGSMGFDGFARMVGFSKYYGREDFNADCRFNGDSDFDGYWAIWDEPFLQYYAFKMGEMRQPFMTALFSASSHHPFLLPEKYEDTFPEGTMKIHRCIGYTDMALRKFFETAEKQPWYRNTIFVITNDHTNMREHDEYRSDIGTFRGPLLIFDPCGETVPAGERDMVAQQTDIMPTVLGLLRYGKPYVAYGVDLTATAPGETWAVNYINNVYQYVSHGRILQFDGRRRVGYYDIDDHLMKHDLSGGPGEKECADSMEMRLKAIIQTYMERRGR